MSPILLPMKCNVTVLGPCAKLIWLIPVLQTRVSLIERKSEEILIPGNFDIDLDIDF